MCDECVFLDSTPGAGYYNDDDVPDFMIIFNYGPGYPLYYYSQVTILDERNGKPLLDPPMKISGSVHSSSLSVSFEGHGNDAFIYWGLCAGHEQDTSEFKYANEVTGGSKSRVNFCIERFGTDDVTRQFILNRNMNIPGEVMYDSNTDFGERQSFNDYSPLDHSKKNSVISRQDKKNSYPQSLEDFYYNRRHHDDGAYRRPYQRKSSSTSNRRRGRHLGAHDADGVQRLISTGSLAPPLDAEYVRRGDSIDVVFAVYWFYPSEDHLILSEEEDCIRHCMDNELQRMNPENQFYGLDHDGFINHVEDIS
ncbi:hypothetical protein BSL78_23866 [Apostichopus japonicus]|uniref:Uncharacterized protein n=1 Tax=Stichopus japonicus TaxID=307972 RepID=A0A2G8JU59_STIJA|nr:hypothetical protein BSL78_23866 [Apostichopus japonicus]